MKNYNIVFAFKYLNQMPILFEIDFCAWDEIFDTVWKWKVELRAFNLNKKHE